MALASGTYQIGPDTGHLHLRTARQGMAAKVGHDLLIALQRWSGQIVLDGDDLAAAQVSVEIDLGSLEILEGTGGVAALSAADTKDIAATASRLLDVEAQPKATFRSTGVTPSADGSDSGAIEGTLSLHGSSGSLTLTVTTTGPSSWTGTATLLQSAYGIKPYKAFFGALRLADPVDIEVTVDLSGA